METIKLDLIPRGKMPSLHASQYDDGRAYHIDLTENRAPYTLDGTETISLTVRKCDNTLVTMDIANTFANQSYIEFVTTEQMNACAGFNVGEIVLEENGDRIGSLNFYLLVEQAPDEGGLTSQSEINNLDRQIDDYLNETLPDQVAEVAPAVVESVAPSIVENIAPSIVGEIATPIVNDLVPAKVNEVAPSIVNELVPPKVAEVAPSVLAEVAPPIVSALVPGAVGDNYYTKSQIDTSLNAINSEISSLEVMRYPENIFNKASMVVENAVWYKASPVGKTFTTPNAQANYNALTIPITGLGQNVTSVTLKQAKSSGTVNIYSWYAVDENMVALASYQNVNPAASIADGYTISGISEGTKYLLISLVYYNQATAEGNNLSVVIGSTAKDYTPYFAPFKEAKSETADKALAEVEHKRSVLYISKDNDDTNLFLKFLEAFDKGNVDVYLEKSTYTLSNAYDYMLDVLGWTWTCGLPVGNGCRYFLNDSIIISNPTSDDWSESRNVIDCRARGTDYEIHDVTLINNGGRYCVHDEGNNSPTPYLHKYENVIMIYNKTALTPDSGAKAFGAGGGFDASLVFNACQFIHNNGQTGGRFAIHAPTTNPNNLPCKLHLIMRDSYFDNGNVYINVYDGDRDTVDFYLFGNSVTEAFVNPIVDIIENNNTVRT